MKSKLGQVLSIAAVASFATAVVAADATNTIEAAATVAPNTTEAVAAVAPEWLPVKAGKQGGISGMALLKGEMNQWSFLIVHDNKKPDQARLAVVTVTDGKTVSCTPLTWPENALLPVDLEAVTPVPGQTDTYLALASAGDVFQVRVILKENRVEVINNFRLPDIKPNDNYESIALYNAGGKMLTAWGHRGDGASPGVLHWGIVDLSNGTFTNTSSVDFIVPWPEGANVRHISDVVIDEKGTLYVSAALDLGDDGPFSSVIYKAGALTSTEAGITFQKLDTLVKICQANGYKMEGIVLLPGGTSSFAAGSDDENAGSFLRMTK